jgi:hypothetical protein
MLSVTLPPFTSMNLYACPGIPPTWKKSSSQLCSWQPMSLWVLYLSEVLSSFMNTQKIMSTVHLSTSAKLHTCQLTGNPSKIPFLLVCSIKCQNKFLAFQDASVTTRHSGVPVGQIRAHEKCYCYYYCCCCWCGGGLNIIPSRKHISYIQCVSLDDWLNIKLCVLKCKTVVFLQKISTAVGTNSFVIV